MRTILSLLSFLLLTRGAVAQSLPGPPFAEPAQPPKIVYLLCKGAVWSHENGFGASSSTPGTTTIRIDPGARKATFQVLILGELQGELKASDEAYASQAALARPHLHMGRSITAVELNVNRFTGRASIAYLLGDGGQHPAFAGDCLPASPKF